MKTITKIKIRRWLNRRSNGVVEQIEKVMLRLQTWIEKLDAEQDAANEAMKAELARLKEAAETELERMEAELLQRKAELADEERQTKQKFQAIIDESASETERARKVQSNVKALVE